MENILTKAFSTKFIGTSAILMGDHAFLFQNSQKHEHRFVDIANAGTAKFEFECK